MNEGYIWKFLWERLGNTFAAAGLMGNLYAESGLNPQNLENKYEIRLGFTDKGYTQAVDSGIYDEFVADSAGYGLAQWTHKARKQKLLDFAKEQGTSIGDPNMQLEFLWRELSSYKSVMRSLLAATSVQEASDLILTKYEMPANQSDSVKAKRAAYGQKYYDKFAASPGKETPGEKKEIPMFYDPNKVIQAALNEVGYLEKKDKTSLDDKTANAGTLNYTKYARDLDDLGFYNGKKNGVAWCDVFIDWCFVQAYGLEAAAKLTYQTPGKANCGAGCRYSRDYYKKNGRLFDKPEPGDQVFFYPKDGIGGSSIQHTGLVYDVDDEYLYTVEGNTNGANGVIANGGGVCQKKYKLTYNRLAGFGRPDWSLLNDVQPDPAIEQMLYDAVVQADNGYPVKMRASASSSGKIMRHIPLGTTVHVLEEKNEIWAKISYLGETGYMMRNFLAKAGDQSSQNDKFNRLVDLLRQAYFLTIEISEDRGL